MMKAIFYINGRAREMRIAREMAAGAKQHGISFEVRLKEHYGKGRKYEGPDIGADVTMAYGVKSRDILKDHADAGVNWMILDKGYIRKPGPHGVELYTRISVNETYPLKALAKVKEAPPLRWEQTGRRLGQTWGMGQQIILAGSSQKFYDYFGVGDETRFHAKLIRHITRLLREVNVFRPIIFRPKPSYEKRHGGADEQLMLGADGLSLPDESIQAALKNAWCLVTFASNAACDAVFAGVPAIVLGPHMSSLIAGNTKLEDILNPVLPRFSDRQRWAHKLAWEQWTLKEMASGEAWEHLLPRIKAGPLDQDWYDWGREGPWKRADDADDVGVPRPTDDE